MTHRVDLAPFDAAHLSLLAGWLDAAHVRRWFPVAGDVLDFARGLPDNARQRLIVSDGQPVGYLRWTYVPREVLDSIGFDDIAAGAADIDLLIGEVSQVGRGIGPQALERVVDELRAEGIAPLAALTTSIDNTDAHKAFVRAGFEIDREYAPEGFGPCYLMIRPV